MPVADSGLLLEPKDKISRFVTSMSEIRKTSSTPGKSGPEVKTKLFMPQEKEEEPLELSTFHSTGLSSWETKELGQKEITGVSGRNVYGHGIVEKSDVVEVELSCKYDNTPPRHINVHGWPSDKGARMSVAQQLAAKVNEKHSSLEMYNS